MQDLGDGWGEWPGDGDPIGIASARLLALGVERTRRLDVLRFLGILLDHAGRDGVVRADPAVLAGEFRLERGDVRSHVRLLERAGILSSEAAGLRIEGFRNRRVTGLPEGEAMALLASVLGNPVPGTSSRTTADDLWLDEEAATPVTTPAAAPLQRVLSTAGTGGGDRRRTGTPVGAALALITGIVLVAAGVFARPAPDRAELREVAAGGPVTTITIPTTIGGSSGPLGTGRGPAPAPAPEDGVVTGSGSVPGSAGAPSGGAASPGDGGSIAVEASCPSQLPGVSDLVAEVEPADLGSVVAASPWVVSVEGLLVAGAETASVTSIPVVVHFSDGSQVSGEALPAPLSIEPGRAIRWSTTIDAGATTVPEVSSVSAGAPVWRWADPELASTCPAP